MLNETLEAERDYHRGLLEEYKRGYKKGYADAKTEQRWIPVTEKLPEEYGEYRITWKTSLSDKPYIADSEFEQGHEWDDEHDRFKGRWLLDDYIKTYPGVEVIAWKPIGEPYTEGES